MLAYGNGSASRHAANEQKLMKLGINTNSNMWLVAFSTAHTALTANGSLEVEEDANDVDAMRWALAPYQLQRIYLNSGNGVSWRGVIKAEIDIARR